jgi:hypothetical protein
MYKLLIIIYIYTYLKDNTIIMANYTEIAGSIINYIYAKTTPNSFKPTYNKCIGIHGSNFSYAI